MSVEEVKSKHRKRSTLHVSQRTYDQLEKQSKETGKFKLELLDEICTEILNGEHDSLMTPKSEFRSMSIYQDSLSSVREYLKGYEEKVSDLLVKVIDEREKSLKIDYNVYFGDEINIKNER